MAANFDRVERGVSAARLFEVLAEPTILGSSVDLPDADNGVSGLATVANETTTDIQTGKAVVVNPDRPIWKVELSNGATASFPNPQQTVDFILDEYAK